MENLITRFSRVTLTERDISKACSILKNGFTEVLKLNNKKLSFEELYRNAYDLICHAHVGRIRKCLKEAIEEYLMDTIHVQLLASLDDDFVKELTTVWKNYERSCSMIHEILMYLNQDQIDTIKKECLVYFRNQVVCDDVLKLRIKELLYKMVKKENNKEAVDEVSILIACQMLKTLGINIRPLYLEEPQSSTVGRQGERSIENEPFDEETWDLLKEEMDEVWILEQDDRALEKLKRSGRLKVRRCCITTGPTTSAEPNLDEQSAKELYLRIEKYIKNIVEDIKNDLSNLTDETYLNCYVRKWNKYLDSSAALNDMLDDLNRFFCKKVEDGLSNNIGIIHLALVIWKEHLLIPMESQVSLELLEYINEGRNGEAIDSKIIRDVIGSFRTIDCSIDKKHDLYTFFLKQSWKVYADVFEIPFLENTKKFYERESEFFLRNNTWSNYMKKVEYRLNEEDRKAGFYLCVSSMEKLKICCRTALIKDHLKSFKEEFLHLLSSDNSNDLARLHRLVSAVSDIRGQFHRIYENYLKTQFCNQLKQCRESALKNPELYMTTILGIHTKHRSFIVDRFDSDGSYLSVFDICFSEVVNSNVSLQGGITTIKCNELLAKYCDGLLKKSSKNLEYSELEEALNQAVIVFKYIEDKDVFQEHFKKYFAKRLVQQLSISDDAEASMINKLKLECCTEYVMQLQRMLQDIRISKDLNFMFKNKFRLDENKLGIDFNVHVLSSRFWPFQQTTNFSPPQELEKSISEFDFYYGVQHTGRKLIWLYNLAKGEVATNCFMKRYIFQVSTYQMAILLQYNNDVSFTVKQLQDSTNLNFDILIQVLHVLLKTKILVSHPGEKALEASTKISLFSEYKNKNTRININVPLKAEKKIEHDTIVLNIETNRNIFIEAAIVRIMKARKQMAQNKLMEEVVKELSSRFKADLASVKKCIAVIVSKGYIEPTDEDKTIFNYVA